MKGRIAALALAALVLTGCGGTREELSGPTQYQATFLTLFDTVTTVLGYAESEEAFQTQAQAVHDALLEYHQLFDIYHDYPGINNLKTVNDQAGKAPVQVDERILRLLEDCRDYYDLTGGRVNVAMGGVLGLWHDARTHGVSAPQDAALPEEQALQAAAEHSSWEDLILDEAASTVFLADPQLRLDVGAVAKGWAVEQVCRTLPAGLTVSVGGNVRVTGPKPSGEPWVVGVQSPDGESGAYLHTLNISDGSVVTSGDYQRAYVVDGVSYHHIIDPDTLYPARLWRAVTVVCGDSGLADCLSTALFLLPQAEGQALLEQTGAEAVWVQSDGTLLYSPGFAELIRT